MDKKVLKYKDEYLENLFNLLRIDSVLVEQPEIKDAPFGKGCVDALNYVLDLGAKMGFKTRNVNNVCGHIEFGEGEEILGILCHLDVVPTGDGWTNPPFDPVMKDGIIYARGVNDDKGPLMSALYAMKYLKDSGFVPNKRVRLIVGTDEETASRGLKKYLEVCETPNFGFSPDAEFPLIYGEKGILSIDIVSNEKTELKVQSGDRYNVVPEKCLGTFHGKTYETVGKRAHAMEPRNGDNALLKFANLYSDMFNNNLLKFCSKYLNDSRLNDLGLNYTHPEMGDLTCNVAICDIKDGEGKIGLNLRYPIEWDKENFYKVLKEKANEYGLKVNVLVDSIPHYVNPKGDMIEKLHRAYIEVTKDDKTPLLTIGGGTYARMLKNAVAFGAGLPGREEVAHNVDEYMSLEDLFTALKIYIRAIELLTK